MPHERRTRDYWEAAETKVVRPDTLTLGGRSASVIAAGVVLNKFQPGPL